MSNDKIEQYLKLVRETYPHSSNPVVENALRTQRRKFDAAMPGFFELVRNVPDTADDRAPGGSWKDYWTRGGIAGGCKVNAWPVHCSVCDCMNPAEHGAHVRDSRGRVSIIPMCAEHNNPNNVQPMLLKVGTKRIPASEEGVS